MKPLRFGLVGGGGISHSHILGATHNQAARLCCGCFSRNEAKNLGFGARYDVPQDRIYPEYATMAQQEATRADRPDFIVVCTPNSSHYEVCKAFLSAGFPVVCDKPLAVSPQQAEALQRLAQERDLLCAVTYTFAGQPMIHLMRALYAEKQIGNGYYCNLTYYLGRRLGDVMKGKADGMWRFSPDISGKAGSLGDIGSHIEYIARFVLGDDMDKALARLVYEPGGVQLDSLGCVLFETKGGLKGQINYAQLACGYDNDVSVQLLGDGGTLSWRFAEHNRLTMELLDGRSVTWRDPGIPHPALRRFDGLEPMLVVKNAVGFVTIYADYMEALSLQKQGKPYEIRFPTFADGAKGVRFIHAALRSQDSGNQWMQIEEEEP